MWVLCLLRSSNRLCHAAADVSHVLEAAGGQAASTIESVLVAGTLTRAVDAKCMVCLYAGKKDVI
jgi:hypothetical protein